MESNRPDTLSHADDCDFVTEIKKKGGKVYEQKGMLQEK